MNNKPSVVAMEGKNKDTSVVFTDPFEEHAAGGKLKTWRASLDTYLNHVATQALIIVVVIVDMLLITALILIEFGIIRNPSAPSPPGPTRDPSVGTAENALNVTHIIVLSAFLFEILLRIIAKGRKITADRLQLLDCFVVGIAFTVYIAMTAGNAGKRATYPTGYIVVLRLWRIACLYYAITEPIKEEALRAKIFYSNAQKKAEDRLHKVKAALGGKEREVEVLKDRIRELEQTNYREPAAALNLANSRSSPNVNMYINNQSAARPADEPSRTDRLVQNGSVPNGASSAGSVPLLTTEPHVPDIVENTPEHSVTSSVDYKDEADSHRLQVLVENHCQPGANIQIKIDSPPHEVGPLVSKEEETKSIRDTSGILGTTLSGETILAGNSSPARIRTNDDLNLVMRNSPQGSKVSPGGSSTKELVSKEDLHLLSGGFKEEYAFMNEGFDERLTQEELSEIKRVSQIKFDESYDNQDDVPMTDL